MLAVVRQQEHMPVTDVLGNYAREVLCAVISYSQGGRDRVRDECWIHQAGQLDDVATVGEMGPVAQRDFLSKTRLADPAWSAKRHERS